jgi:hypothetical protein
MAIACDPFADVAQSGAPRSMKMGTIASQCRYDVEACFTLREPKRRRPTIPYYA